MSCSIQLDDDVQNEILRIDNSNINVLKAQEPLIVKNVLKIYEKNNTEIYAVNNLTFGVKKHQCFGLLGLNGAGKTSTFKIISGELDPNKGDVLVGGVSIRSNKHLARQNLGYCPQFDRLPDYLTVNETLNLFAKLRGLEPKLIKRIVEDMQTIFQINQFKKVLVQNLSGGNKRKLSSAIGFLGKPSVVILDEPSTGMDPAARRFLWNIIRKARDLGMTIVLSSHSMEECEALCDKLGILMKGQLYCFGSMNHIKEKYGDGYRLVIKVKNDDQIHYDVLANNLEKFILNNFKNSVLEDKQYETLFFKINTQNDDDNNNNDRANSYSDWDKSSLDSSNKNENKSSLALSNIFSILEKNKQSLRVESYLLSQTTLEQIFVSFANKSNKLNENIKSPNNNNNNNVIKSNFDNDNFDNISKWNTSF